VTQSNTIDAVLRGGLVLLFSFVSLVPHRYLPLADWTAARWGPEILVCLLLAATLTKRWRAIPSFFLLLPLLILAIINGASALASEDPSLGISREIYYLLTGVCLCFVCWTVFNARGRLFLSCGVLLASVVALIGLLEFLGARHLIYPGAFETTNPLYARLVSGQEDFGRRVLSTVGHPVYLGAYLVLFVPPAISFARFSRGSWTGVVRLVGVAALVVGLMLTFSRGAWAGGVLGILIYFRGSVGSGTWKTAAVVAGLVVTVLSFDSVWETLEERQTWLQVRTFQESQRGVAYAQATGVMLEQPLLGVGAAHYRHLAGRHGDYDDTPDNMYLRVFAENGVAGFCVLSAVFLGVARFLQNGSRRLVEIGDIQGSDLCHAVLAGLCGFCLDMVTCDALAFPLTRMAFWMVVGVGLALAGTCRAELKQGSDLVPFLQPKTDLGIRARFLRHPG